MTEIPTVAPVTRDLVTALFFREHGPEDIPPESLARAERLARDLGYRFEWTRASNPLLRWWHADLPEEGDPPSQLGHVVCFDRYGRPRGFLGEIEGLDHARVRVVEAELAFAVLRVRPEPPPRT
jgi:hypothetical protein